MRVATDGLGVPEIRAASRQDAFRALGYVTARDRLFQMDLLRRKSAGRLAEILGPPLVEGDARQRLYGVPRAAAAIVARLPADQRAALDAYAQGVNGYLEGARALPLECELLRYRPEPWRPEDSVLVVLGMFQALGDSEEQERTRTVLAHSLPPAVAAFLSADVDRYTRALLGPQAPAPPPMPVDDLRALSAQGRRGGAAASGVLGASAGEPPAGSNGWAVAGTRTVDGRAILANDMHLDLGVPNVWYRARLRYADVDLAGVVLPGVPLVAVGTNRHVAWGLTSLEGDVMDLVRLETDPGRPGEYRTPSGWRRFDVAREAIKVRGGADVAVDVRATIWGPVSPRPLLGQAVAVRWTALDPGAVDLGLLAMDRARTIEEAVSVMNRAAGPTNNVLLAGRDGRVAWTITGRIPQRRGLDGSVSLPWADGRAGWDDYVPPDRLPRVLDPPAGFVVSANNRVPTGEGGPALGHDFANGYRAYRITERLREARGATEASLFQIQLDARSEFFDFYRDLALAALDERAVAGRPLLAEARRALEAWDGRAEASSGAGLGLLVRFRRMLADETFAAWLGGCAPADPTFEFALSDIDTPLQRALERRDLLPAPSGDWGPFLATVLEKAAAEVKRRQGGRPLDRLEWGALNRVQIAHPLSGAFAGAAPPLDMPAEPLSGCGFCVRMAAGTLGASERLVVSPGREGDAIFHMPAGQSGEPRSPHYRDQQRAWVEGRPLPLLPGPAARELSLAPAR
ncbi:MAG TPA: penicillin acylase family protein [Polyangiaceae bacterium]|nr:penicillin acylase family protein [Polyangiaceae bacterium]